MHMYINIDHIISALDSSIDEDGNIPLYNFLVSLLSGVSNALGCINKFEIDYSDATNTFYIVDENGNPIVTDDDFNITW